MNLTSVQKLARVVRVLILIVFACNIIALLLVPGLAAMIADGGIKMVVKAFQSAAANDGTGFKSLPMFFVVSLAWVWTDLYSGAMTVYLWVCGVCTAIILWQARGVLGNIIAGRTFSDKNGDRLKVAAVCCFVIAAVALAYVIFGLWVYAGEAVFLTFSCMLIFVFLIAGLICLVMSALFRQAAEMKAEQDLTI